MQFFFGCHKMNVDYHFPLIYNCIFAHFERFMKNECGLPFSSNYNCIFADFERFMKN